ncbi:MAG: S-adenosyl-l-methionine hydroxide adenosyltransferase family protein [Microcystaceae cyanobacterium]
METLPPIALLTDFGLKDGYVGIMKGVIADITPHTSLIDISHQIPAQDILSGRFCLMNSYPYFPDHTIYLAVVDPGVGSQRRGIGVKLSKGYYVGPDNGLISGILTLDPAIEAVNLSNPRYWRVQTPSFTFHGRDIFAPIAAYLAKGVSLEQLGDRIGIDSLKTVDIRPIQIKEREIKGSIQYIDGFGNIITNISHELLSDDTWQVTIKGTNIPQGSTYGYVRRGELIALVGSHGWLEIAVNGGSGREQLGVNINEEVVVTLGL